MFEKRSCYSFMRDSVVNAAKQDFQDVVVKGQDAMQHAREEVTRHVSKHAKEVIDHGKEVLRNEGERKA